MSATLALLQIQLSKWTLKCTQTRALFWLHWFCEPCGSPGSWGDMFDWVSQFSIWVSAATEASSLSDILQGLSNATEWQVKTVDPLCSANRGQCYNYSTEASLFSYLPVPVHTLLLSTPDGIRIQIWDVVRQHICDTTGFYKLWFNFGSIAMTQTVKLAAFAAFGDVLVLNHVHHQKSRATGQHRSGHTCLLFCQVTES